MVSFKNRILLIILSCLLFVVCFFSAFNGIGLTAVNADSSDIPSYTFNGSNVGYVGAGFGVNVSDKVVFSPGTFDTRMNTGRSYSGSNFRVSLRTTDWHVGTMVNSGVTNIGLMFEYDYQFLSYYNYFKAVLSIEAQKRVDADGYYYGELLAENSPPTPGTGISYFYNNSSDYNYTKIFQLARAPLSFDWSSSVTQFKSYDFLFYNFDLLQFLDINSSITGSNYYYGVYTAFQLGDISSFNNYVELYDSLRKLQVTSIELGSGYDWSYGTTFDYSMPTDTGLSQRFSYSFGSDMVSYPTYKNFNYVIYNFANGCRLFIHLPIAYLSTADTPQKSVLCWNKRIYYLDSVVVGSNDYNAGYNAGYSAGNNAGYKSGFESGRASGYTQGYSEGLVANNDYTFLGLFSAIIDAPLNAFKSLFNFNILGFNLLDFFTGLLTLAVIIWVVRLLL